MLTSAFGILWNNTFTKFGDRIDGYGHNNG